MEQKKAYIREKISALGIDLTDRQAEQFERYYELLTEWNERMNLTAITEFEEAVQKHFVDSLSIIRVKDLKNADTLIDVGTGAGFPGLPLKIAFPQLQVTLLDSLQKRILFLNEVIRETGLEDVETIHGRAEDFAKPGQRRECFDLCVSRAVANLSTLSEYCLPYVKIGGEFISYKSGNVQGELEQAKNAVFLLGGKLEETDSFTLPGSDIARTIIRIRKVSGCPKKYPRKAGTASKSPLL